MEFLKLADGCRSGLFWCIKKCQISQQDKVLFILGVQIILSQFLVCYRQHLHAIFCHLIHNGMNAGKPILFHNIAVTFIFNEPASAADFVHTSLDDKQILFFSLNQNTCKLSFMIKRQLIELWMHLFKLLKVPSFPRHFLIPENCCIQMIADPCMVKAIQIS